jgi:hypothetical protein
MTGLIQSSRADEQSQRDVTRGIGWLSCGAAGGLAIAWFILLAPGETGSKADWFFGAAVLCVVMVALWQTVTVQRQASARAAEAAAWLHVELAAGEARLDRELELTRKLHEAELEGQRRWHRAEMDAHRQRAELERRHLLDQLQKQAVIEVSRAVSLHTQMLASLWNRGAGILHSTDRDEREQAMLPIFEQIGHVVNGFSVELANARQIVDDDRLSHALESVNEAVLLGIGVAQRVCDDVVDGRATEPNPVPAVQRLMHEKAAEARRLAWDLLRTGLGAVS